MVESKKKPGVLTPLIPKLKEEVVKDLNSKGATFFDWIKFQKLTKNLPPETPIAEILKQGRKK
ncbi:MAG: hypothetical protein NUV58_03585 [Candidatus Roizmanbacteria bacterium]|nr:hypothetical protein [Candidatus Roizmanbacteria bacterium]